MNLYRTKVFTIVKKNNELLILIMSIPAIIIAIYLIYGICCLLGDWNTKKIGRNNAVNYVQEKYGFKPEVIYAERIHYWYWFKMYWENNVKVKMRYEGKEFWVYISGEKKTTDGKDDYQAEEIREAVNERVSSYLGCEPLWVDSWYCINSDYSKYYDGTNLDSFLNEVGSDLFISTVGLDVEKIDLKPLAKDMNASNIVILDYLSEEDYSIARSLNYAGYFDFPELNNYQDMVSGEGVYGYLPLLDEYAKVDGEGNSEYLKVKLKEAHGFLYGKCDETDTCIEKVSADIIKELGMSEEDIGAEDVDVYSVDASSGTTYIYLPKEQYDYLDSYDCKCTYINEDGEREVKSLKDCGIEKHYILVIEPKVDYIIIPKRK